MNIVEFYNNNFTNTELSDADYKLRKFKDNIFVGIDKEKTVSVVIKSSGNPMNPIIQKTKMISVECNMVVQYYLDNEKINGIVHIIKCKTENNKERDIFLELAILLIESGEYSEEGLLDVFRTLVMFFSNKYDVSDNELTGLYGELYTIKKFSNTISIDKYWQSQDKMKFDFSITEKTKVEVKSTVKQLRTHHFRHEQLQTNSYNIYVLSYLFRKEDNGTSLYDLIMTCKDLFKNSPKQSIKLDLILKNVEESRLKNFKFDDSYTERNLKIFRGADIPKFNEFTPEGVANAEYDCDLENTNSIDVNTFITNVSLSINNDN